MEPYLTVICRLPGDAEDALASLLEHLPVLGCQVENVGRELQATVFLAEGSREAVAQVRDGLVGLGARQIGVGQFADQDWLAEYRRHSTPLEIGTRFWVDPHAAAPTAPPPGRIHLVVEPRQAFGTGSHESTKLILLVLERLQVAGRRVLDVGTGSGILALAARALGARFVVGFDIDCDAVCVAHQTVDVQPEPLPVALYAGSTAALRCAPAFDLILVNMIPAESGPLLDDLRGVIAADGQFVLSGLMCDQRLAVERDLTFRHFAVVDAEELSEWTALVCVPR